MEYKNTFSTFDFDDDKSMISTPSRKTREVIIQSLLVKAFAVRVTKHTIILKLHQSAETGRDWIQYARKIEKEERQAPCRIPTLLYM